MKSVGALGEEFRRAAELLRRARATELAARRQGRTALAVVQDEHPLAAALLPPDFDDSDFVIATDDRSLREAEARLALCARCPETGGRCAPEEDERRGKRPVWSREGGFEYVACPRWQEYELRRRLRLSGVGDDLLGCRFETFEQESEWEQAAVRTCEEYVERFQMPARTNLLFAGAANGVGKTHLAISTLAALVRAGKIRSALFVYVPEFLDQVRQSYNEEGKAFRGLVTRASTVDLVVYDDLLAERPSDWVVEQMHLLTDSRWRSGKPSIITTNATPDDIAKKFGTRIKSRLFGDAVGCLLEGRDRRIR